MNKFYSLLFCLVCLTIQGFAQPYTIRGSVTDTLNAAPLSVASVVLIRNSDSVIETHTRTGTDGRFEAHVKTQGKYFLRITFPGFADYIDIVNVKKQTTDLGDLPMISKEHLLKEFVLTQQISAIKIKGDTTEYMADSFKVREGATVEDLLKKLPGIQVDKNGQVIAQGETVQKILVDGEEFFSDDPKVVMKGLQADAVKKVQVYDKKSDQADFTGIDDGQKTKTINLELKEDKKHGYFGKADAGGGSDGGANGYYQNQAMINAFKAKRQLSAFGIGSNTDKAGLGWQDNDKFGSGSASTEITENGEFFNRRTEDDFAGWDGKYNGEGLPSTWTGGGHYANKWEEAKHHLSANYRAAVQEVRLDGNTITQYSLPDSVFRVTDMHKNQVSNNEKHGFDIMYEWKIDSNTSVKITSNAGLKKSNTNSTYETNTYLVANDATTDTLKNNRTITSNAETQLVNTDFLLRKKFKKKGRSLSIDGKENYTTTTSTGLFTSDVFSLASTANTNQRKLNNSGTLAFSGKAVYTEPLSKVVFAEISSGITVNNSTSENKSFDKISDTSYNDAPNSIFSSDYKFNILSKSGGLNFKFVFKDINFNFGGEVSRADYVQTDLFSGTPDRDYHFVNFFPKAAFTYRIGRQTSFNFNYQGGTNQPTISQLQPYRQNTDPLNIVVGNDSLRQSFTNRVSVRFNNYKILQSKFLWANASFSTTSDAITTDQQFDSGINKTSYINMDGNYNGFGFVGYGFKISKTDFMVGVQLSGSIYHVNSMINKRKNSSDNNSITFGPYVNYDKEDKFELRWNPQIIYNTNTSTNNNNNINYYIFNNDLNGSLQLPKKIEIGSSVDMMFREKTAIFNANNNVIKWNAYVEKKLLKKGQLAVRASVFDILNQNRGFSRTATGSIVTQNSYNNIRRYGMLNVIWNFSHTPAGAPPPTGGGMRMMRH